MIDNERYRLMLCWELVLTTPKRAAHIISIRMKRLTRPYGIRNMDAILKHSGTFISPFLTVHRGEE